MKLEYAVPYRQGDAEAEDAAKRLAHHYIENAMANTGVQAPVKSFTMEVEQGPGNGFWEHVLRAGWRFYHVKIENEDC